MAPTVGRLHGKGSFRELSRPDRRGSCGPVNVSFVASAECNAPVSVGYAIGRSHGNAVRRNRLRRRLRASLVGVSDLAPGKYLVRATSVAGELSFSELRASVIAATRMASGRVVAPAAPGRNERGPLMATVPSHPTEPTGAARIVLGAIRLYQGMRAGQLSPCRFYPSCSSYAVEAVEYHGAIRGTWLALRRISRCHPFGGHGVDLVPIRIDNRPPRRGR